MMKSVSDRKNSQISYRDIWRNPMVDERREEFWICTRAHCYIGCFDLSVLEKISSVCGRRAKKNEREQNTLCLRRTLSPLNISIQANYPEGRFIYFFNLMI